LIQVPAVADGTLKIQKEDGTIVLNIDVNGKITLPLSESPIPAGTIIDFAGTAAPTGFMICPTTQTNLSRTTYSALFAAIGTTWGVGDGSTTFGMPWFAADYAAVQASANVGTNSIGVVGPHKHNVAIASGTNGSEVAMSTMNVDMGTGSSMFRTTGTGIGSANLAAGARVLKCVKY
jgi:microcystin-dependent protein